MVLTIPSTTHGNKSNHAAPARAFAEAVNGTSAGDVWVEASVETPDVIVDNDEAVAFPPTPEETAEELPPTLSAPNSSMIKAPISAPAAADAAFEFPRGAENDCVRVPTTRTLEPRDIGTPLAAVMPGAPGVSVAPAMMILLAPTVRISLLAMVMYEAGL